MADTIQSKNLKQLTQELGSHLSQLLKYSSSYEKCHEELFQIISKIGDKELSEGILRLVLKVEFEIFDDNTLETLKTVLLSQTSRMIGIYHLET